VAVLVECNLNANHALSGSGLTCGVGTCMLFTSSSLAMAGCCYAGSYSDCGWVNKCYDYSDYLATKCDVDCQLDTLNLICSSSLIPYCQSWTCKTDSTLCCRVTADLDQIPDKALKTMAAVQLQAQPILLYRLRLQRIIQHPLFCRMLRKMPSHQSRPWEAL
jgi:hypothetical protein